MSPQARIRSLPPKGALSGFGRPGATEMHGNPMNIPPLSIAAAKAALIEQYADATLRRRASMLWGPRGVGKSSVVRQVAAHFGVPLVDLRLTTIEPVDIRGAIYADDVQAKTVWFPPEFLPGPEQPQGILFLDELTAADQRSDSLRCRIDVLQHE